MVGKWWSQASSNGNGTGVTSFYGVIPTVVMVTAWSPVSLSGPKTVAFILPLGSLGLNSLIFFFCLR